MRIYLILFTFLFSASLESAPLLSIICSGRNDNYGGNFLDRMAFFMHSADRFKIKTELVIVEWNPIKGKPGLFEIIKEWDKKLPFKNKVRVIVVSEENHQKFCKYYDCQNTPFSFQEFPAKNVGFRHAKGKYIIQTNPDNFFSLTLIKRVEKAINNQFTGIIVGEPVRIDVKPVSSFVSLIDMDPKNIKNYLEELDQEFSSEIKGDCSPLGDFMLFKKDSVLKMKGFPEDPMGISHFESPFLCKYFQKNKYERLMRKKGFTTYHFDHGRQYSGGAVAQETDKALINAGLNKSRGCKQGNALRCICLSSIYSFSKNRPEKMKELCQELPQNDENWGCFNLKLEEYQI